MSKTVYDVEELPGDWEGEIGEGNHPITKEQGYYHRTFYNDETKLMIVLDTAGGFGSPVSHTVCLYEQRETPDGELVAHGTPSETYEFKADNQMDEKSQRDAEMQAGRKALEIMRTLS